MGLLTRFKSDQTPRLPLCAPMEHIDTRTSARPGDSASARAVHAGHRKDNRVI